MAVTTYIQAINQALAEEMERDPLTFVMGEDVVLSAFGATKGLIDKFGPNRVRNTPIAEAGFVGAAAQHSETEYAQFLSVAGLKLVVPSNPSDMKGLLKSAIRDDNPVIVFEHGALGGHREEIPTGDHLVPLGKAAIKRVGEHVTVIAIGAMVPKAIKVADRLAKENISVEVVDPRTLIPLDEDAILSSVEKTNRAIVFDEGHLRGGAATDIAALIGDKGFDFLDGPVMRVTTLDVPIPFSPPLEKAALANEARVESAIRELVGR
jgi:pyruvate dehydrogenase E1 component beta subunit